MPAASRFDNDLRYRTNDHPNQRQLTPPYVLEPIRASLGGVIELDPCTEPDNPTQAVDFFTIKEDGLEQEWDRARTIFVNPPYSKAREPWVEKCIFYGEYGHKVALLIPAHTDTRIFQKAAVSAQAIVFIRGRVKFGVLRENRRQEAASHGSAVLVWNCDLVPLAELGRVMVPFSV